MTSPGSGEGPWECDTGDTGIMDSRIAYVSVDDGRKEIARVRLDRDDWRSVVQLITAAPDLLSVAREMLPRNLCVTNPNVSDSTIVPLECTMGDLRKVAAAIAKATGKATP